MICFIFICMLALTSSRRDLVTNPKPCSYLCKQGACSFENCSEMSECPGGACFFKNCNFPSCTGGACVFEACAAATCAGGGCTFLNPRDTLENGYCNGENCDIDGHPHPNFAYYVAS